MSSYAGKLNSSLVWWLSKRRSFIINDEYSVELLFIDRTNNSAKIKITNLKTAENQQISESFDYEIEADHGNK